MDRDGIKLLASLMDATILSAPMSAKWMNISCPFAAQTHQHGTDNTPSFGVQINKNGVSRMFCLSCGKGGQSLGEVLMELKQLGHAINFKELNKLAMAEFDGAEFPTFDDEEDEKTGLFVFDEAWLDSFPLAINNGHSMTYLAGRDMPKSLTALLGLRYDPFERRVLFPIRGEDQKLYGLHGRSIDEDVAFKYMAYGYKKRRNPHVLLGSDTVDWNKPVVLAESVFDYARAKQVYRNCLSPLHATIGADAFQNLEPSFEIVTLFDGDKAGTGARKRIRKWAGKKRIVKDVYLPDGRDGGSLTVEEMAAELAEFVDLDTFIA